MVQVVHKVPLAQVDRHLPTPDRSCDAFTFSNPRLSFFCTAIDLTADFGEAFIQGLVAFAFQNLLITFW